VYSVGQNSGMKLSADGGIAIHVAHKQPDGVPAENWLPIPRKDLDLDIILRDLRAPSREVQHMERDEGRGGLAVGGTGVGRHRAPSRSFCRV